MTQQPPILSASRHPFQIFMMCFIFATSLPILIYGDENIPGSINEAIDDRFIFFWALILALGSVTTLIGSAYTNRTVGILIEQVGLMAVGVGTIFYGVVAVYTIGPTASLPGGMASGFGFACIWRWNQLRKFLNTLGDKHPQPPTEDED